MKSNKKNTFINIITDSFSAYKFVEPHTRYIDKKTGNTGYIACNFDSFDDAKSFQITHNPIDVKIEREIRLLRDFLSFIRLIILFVSNKYSVIHTHNAKAGIIARLAAKLSGAKNIIHTTYDYGFINLEENKIKKMLFVFLERLCGKFTDRLIVVSNTTRADALRYKIIDPRRIKVIPEVPSIDEFDRSKIDHGLRHSIKEKYSIKKNKEEVMIGTVARLVPHKGVDTLLEAASTLIEKGLSVRFLIIGGGPEENNLKEMAEKRKISKFLTFTGFIEDQSEMIYLFSFMDIFWLATKSEGQGLVYSEAQLMDIPVIGSDISPCREMIGDGGLLCDPNNSDEFASCAERIMNSELEAADLIRKGKKHALSISESTLDDKLNVYESFWSNSTLR